MQVAPLHADGTLSVAMVNAWVMTTAIRSAPPVLASRSDSRPSAPAAAPRAHAASIVGTRFVIEPLGPFSLREAALFGFGQRHEEAFDGCMRLAFCLDGYA